MTASRRYGLRGACARLARQGAAPACRRHERASPDLPRISPATATYLSQLNLEPDELPFSEIRKNQLPDYIADLDRFIEPRPLGGAFLIHRPLYGSAVLKVWRREFHYLECPSGEAVLHLRHQRLPESVCASLAGAKLPLSRLVEADDLPFYAACDPVVLSVANEKGFLLIRLLVSFRLEHWKGLDVEDPERAARQATKVSVNH